MLQRTTCSPFVILRRLAVILSFLLTGTLLSAQATNNKYTDSIYAVIKAMPDDTHKVAYIIHAYDEWLWMYDQPESYNQLKYAVRLAKQLNADTLEYNSYRSMAHYCDRVGANDYALYNLQAALNIAEKWGDSTRIASCWSGMAKAFSSVGQFDLATSYYFKALPHITATGNIERIGRLHTFIGWNYESAGNVDSARYFLELGRKERAQAGYADGVIATDGSLLGLYLRQGMYDNFLDVLAECMLIQDTTTGNDGRDRYSDWWGAYHDKLGHLDSALWYYQKGAAYCAEHNDYNTRMRYYEHIAGVLDKMGRKAEAYEYFKQAVQHKDSVDAQMNKIHLDQAREVFDVENKNREIEELQHSQELSQRDIDEKDRQRVWLVTIALVSSLLVFVALFAYRQKQKSAGKLEEQNKIIEEKNRDITDSILYAQRIQKAILPSMEQIAKALPDSFVLFRPKDIVSGDFFWFNETTNAYYLAAVDCTGHGVPGAMMSMIGYNFLGQIVNEQDVDQPAEILNVLHRKVLLALNKDYTSHDMKDGMDVALIRIDKKTKNVSFTGAVRPLYVMKNNALEIIKGDIYSIGGIKDVDGESFTQHEIPMQDGMCIYIFSDGIADQFGGPKGKKFKYSQLKELLLKNSSRPMEEQYAQVQRAFDEWKGPHEQVDDVLVIGVRL